jgi:3-aminobutyryl-CoA ammonia-lyase
MEKPEAVIRLRLGSEDAHYGGGLVAGSKILEIFGDVATELSVRHDGDEGLLRAYESTEFLAPVYAGDFIEARGRLIGSGNTSRRYELEAYKVIVPRPDINDSAADVLDEPLLVCRSIGVGVVLTTRQRIR